MVCYSPRRTNTLASTHTCSHFDYHVNAGARRIIRRVKKQGPRHELVLFLPFFHQITTNVLFPSHKVIVSAQAQSATSTTVTSPLCSPLPLVLFVTSLREKTTKVMF